MIYLLEDYVSFEGCKLLKDLGFEQDYYCHPVWWMNGNNQQLSFEGDNDFPYRDNVCCGMTQAEALKFLRERYRLNVEILIAGLVKRPDIPVNWKYRIYDSANNIDYSNSTVFDTYEEASKVAINHCFKILKNNYDSN